MAVSQMEKISVIGPLGLEEKVLQIIQGMRNVELISANNNLSNDEILTPYTTPDQEDENAEASDVKETSVDYNRLLKRVQDALVFLKRYSPDDKQSTLKRKNVTMDQLQASYHEKELLEKLAEIEQLSNQLQIFASQKKELSVQENEFARWQYLDVLPKNTNLDSTRVVIGIINNKNQELFAAGLTQIPDIYTEEVYSSPHHNYYFLLYLQDQQVAVSQLLDQVSFKTVNYPYDVTPKEQYKIIKQELADISKKESKLKKEIGNLAKEIASLSLTEEVILASQQRQAARTLMAKSEDLFVLEGWLPKENQANILAALHEKIPQDNIVVEFSDAIKGEDVPTHLKNNRLVAPFEMLTEMYSLPKYDEVDPTPLMTPFYLVFFGMMVADIGYGLVMLIGTLIARRFFVLKRGMTRFVDFFMILSIPTILWGLIYGSFFGASLPAPFPILSTTDDVTTILLLSVVFGFIQIMFGLLVNGVLHIRKKEYLNAVKEGFAWQGLLIGLVIALLGQMILHNSTILYLGIIVAALCALSIVTIPIFQSTSKLKGLAKGVYGLYGVTGYIGDLVSYTRLMALGISGGSIAAAFNMLVGYMPPVVRFTFGVVLIIGLQALNLFLSLLSAYVHGARLQYVEFFGKFFTGGGRVFKPFTTQEKYINVENKTKKEEIARKK